MGAIEMPVMKSMEWKGPPVALFWDQSLPWGLLCMDALSLLGIPFHFLTAGDIRAGWLSRYRVLLVPGGWASHKARALGDLGAGRIRDFVNGGGSYLGFCGGAGLALASAPSIRLVPLERMSLEERLPSASGEIWIRGKEDHPVWKDLPRTLPVSVWWPSQFSSNPFPGTACLGAYSGVGFGFMVADLPVDDLREIRPPWNEWEKIYGINLNPERLLGQPAIMEVQAGKGALILSYPHLETPGDEWGNRLLCNCLFYLDDRASLHISDTDVFHEPPCRYSRSPDESVLRCLQRAQGPVEELIAFGERNLLWKWRRFWLLQWRRGIRGLEYGSLAVAMRRIVQSVRESVSGNGSCEGWMEDAEIIARDVDRFCGIARNLLIREKVAGHVGGLSKLGEVNQGVDELRAHLFGKQMKYGGVCKTLFDGIGRFLLESLRFQSPRHDR